MSLFGSNKISEDELDRIFDSNYKFIRVGRDRRVSLQQIAEYEELRRNRIKVTLVSGEVILLGIDIETFDNVVNASPFSMSNETGSL